MNPTTKKRGVLVYLPEGLHRRLKAKAALEGTSVSAMIEEAARRAYPDAALESSFEIQESSILYSKERSPERSRKRKKMKVL